MESIAEQLKSKKFRGMLIGFGVVIAVQLGMDEATAKALVPWLSVIAAAYIGGQGLADLGKAKGKLDIKAMLASATTAAKGIVASQSAEPPAAE